MKNLPNRESESGQTLVIVLLVVAVSLAVGLGVSGSAVSTTQQATFSEESTQALHYAEACAEDALWLIKEGEIPALPYSAGLETLDSDPDNECEYTVAELTEIFPGVVSQDEVAEAKLIGFAARGGTGLTIYWCDRGSAAQACSLANAPSLEIVLVKLDAEGAASVARFAYGPSVAGRSDGFAASSDSDDTVHGINFAYEVLVPVDETVQAVRIFPRYNNASIAVVPVPEAVALPHQGYLINSAGVLGRSTRQVQITRTEPVMPAIFDYALFSGSETNPLEKR